MKKEENLKKHSEWSSILWPIHAIVPFIRPFVISFVGFFFLNELRTSLEKEKEKEKKKYT